MAIVKITSKTRNPALAKATIRYIMHRRERSGEKITRVLYGREGETTKHQAYETIDQAGRRITFFRITLSPDPNAEDRDKDLNLREVTAATMRVLQAQFPDVPIHYFAAIHDGHTTKRHVNLIALVPAGRLTKAHLALLRDAASGNAKKQRQFLDQARFPFVATPLPQQRRLQRFPDVSAASGADITTTFLPLADPLCPICRSAMTHAGRWLECDTCGLSIAADAVAHLEIRRSPELELTLAEEGATL